MWNVQLCVDIMDSHLSVCVFYALFAVLFHWGEASRCIFWIPLMVLLCTDGIGLLLKLIFILFSLCQSRWHLQTAYFFNYNFNYVHFVWLFYHYLRPPIIQTPAEDQSLLASSWNYSSASVFIICFVSISLGLVIILFSWLRCCVDFGSYWHWQEVVMSVVYLLYTRHG